MPPWSWLTGHIGYLFWHAGQLPPLATVNLAFFEMSNSFRDEEMFLLDIWPVNIPLLLVFNPDAAHVVCQKMNLAKEKKNEVMIRPITGGINLLSMNGELWRYWRTLFSPGFSTGVMADQVPHLVDQVSSFCARLEQNADKGIVLLNHFTSEMTFKIILKICL